MGDRRRNCRYPEPDRFYKITELDLMVRIVQIAISFIWVVACRHIVSGGTAQISGSGHHSLGLGIGRLVFQALNMVEIAFAAVLAATFLIARRKRPLSYLFLGVAVLLGLQTFGFCPHLTSEPRW